MWTQKNLALRGVLLFKSLVTCTGKHLKMIYVSRWICILRIEETADRRHGQTRSTNLLMAAVQLSIETQEQC